MCLVVGRHCLVDGGKMVEGRCAAAKGRDTFIVKLMLAVLRFLYHFTIFRMAENTIARWKPNGWSFSWFFVDLWVIAWTFIAFISYATSVIYPNKLVAVVSVFGVIRIYEILVVQSIQILGDEHKLRSYSRTFTLAIFNIVEIILWFSAWYVILQQHGLITVDAPVAISALRLSIGLMVANSLGKLILQNVVASMIVTAQSAVGLFMITVVAARLISILPRPSAHSEEDT